jgi:hypothetical protein
MSEIRADTYDMSAGDSTPEPLTWAADNASACAIEADVDMDGPAAATQVKNGERVLALLLAKGPPS